MSTQTERPETTSATSHELDQLSGVVPSPVRPASPRLAWVALTGGVLVGLALWLFLDLPVAVAAVLGYLVYLVAVHVTYRIVGGARVATDQTMRALVYGAFVLAIIPLISLLWTVVENGALRALQPDYLMQSMNGVTGVHDREYAEGNAPMIGGAYHAVIGTLIITGIATVISVPIGLFTAIYLVEYGGKSRLAKVIRFLVDVMTGIPSIVAGLFAFALFAVLFGIGTKNGMAGAVALSVLMIPTVVRNSEEMLRIVPHELREAALALGVPKWLTIAKVVLPTAASGLASGITLAIARVIGETAPLLVAVGFTRAVNVDPTEGPMSNLALFAYYMFTRPLNPGYRDPSLERAWAAAVLLVVIVIALNLLARAIAKFFAPKTR
ncbi:phosphate ABC transporter permease PstA [Ornithinimicrobium cryptoxanthini]|uniref:Phosphate transport system permease protein PstA n=1 Tax=Ornithinimicrobium cryptoxanthini TaxID=2934161 RepID=A0ABY4YJ87_9MICO|nr:phosphate ABC transporter permease PstA [Ornithinimicrobium cryptoxanthini]USQ76839.1 phosphate ABC transporter permease PstA [Ornithinimicrobium cryptoxanthini]